MFNSAVSSTHRSSSRPSALAVWILGCIGLVMLALVFYVLILFNKKRLGKRTNPLDEESLGNLRIDLDPYFFAIHFLAFGLFIMTYFSVYLIF